MSSELRAKPKFMTKDQVAQDVIASERKILEARAAESGKPPEIVAKMVEGGINKFLAEITLMGQPFVKDDKQTVAASRAHPHGSETGKCEMRIR